MKDISVCLMDSDIVVRKGIKKLLEMFARVKEVSEAENATQLIKLCKSRLPNVVIYDNQAMGDSDAIRQLIENYDDIKVIALTSNDNVHAIAEAIAWGVHGYLLKRCQPEELEKAIYSVHDNDFHHSEVVSKALRKVEIERHKHQGPFYIVKSLSKREIEILIHYCQQKNAKEIAFLLSISEKTVHVHKRNIMRKIGARNSVGLVHYALESGLIESDLL